MYSSLLKAGRLEIQEELIFQLSPKAREKSSAPTQGSQVTGVPSYLAFLFYSVLQLIG